MESYIGFNLQFFTEKEKVSGILNDFNIEREIVEVDCNGIKKEIPICEILKINIIPNDSVEEDSEDKFCEQEKNIEKLDLEKDYKKNNEINIPLESDEKEISKVIVKDDMNKENICNSGEVDENVGAKIKANETNSIKDELLYNKTERNRKIVDDTKVKEKTSFKLSNGTLMNQLVEDPKTLLKSVRKSTNNESVKNLRTSNNKQKSGSIEKDISRPGNTIKRLLYKNLLNEAFVRYGPTVEEFICYGSLQMIKTLKSIIKNVHAKIDIVLGDIPLFNRLGYVVARSLILTYKDVCVVEPEFIDVNTYKFKLTYTQSNGKVCNDVREGSEVLLSFCRTCDINIEDISNLKKVIYVYEPSNDLSGEVESVLIGFGAIIEEFLNFKGDYYVLDIMISDILYRKYNIRKGFSGSIMKLTTNRK